MAKESDKKSAQVPRMVNKKAFSDYEIVEKVEAGLVLVGSEVKSLRAGGADMSGSFARLIDGQCWLLGCNIAPYTQAGDNNHEPMRKRKLLLHRRQITKLSTKLLQRGFTLVPLRIFRASHLGQSPRSPHFRYFPRSAYALDVVHYLDTLGQT